MKITKLSLWLDTGFGEGSIEVPASGASLPSPDYVYDDIVLEKGREFTQIRLSDDFLNLYKVTYLKAEMEDSAGAAAVFFGWVDSVDLRADTHNPLVFVNWHVDLWRTYVSGAVFGSGIVQRRKAGGELPPQPYPFRYMTHDGSGDVRLSPRNDAIGYRIYWVYLAINFTEGQTGIVWNRVACFPIRTTGYAFETAVSKCPSLGEVVGGAWDEVLGIDPGAVKAAFISPYEPNGYNLNGDIVNLDGWRPLRFVPEAKSIFVPSSTTSSGVEGNEIVFDNPVKSTDTETYSLCGFDNEVIGGIPWGISIDRIQYRAVLGSNSAYVEFRGKLGASARYEDAHALGLCWTIPMIPLENTENALSAYRYTGARQSDIQQAVLNADKARVAGYINTATSAASGAFGGAMASSSPYGALAGAVLGGAMNAVTTELKYRYDTGEFLDRAIGIKEYRAANQTNGLLAAGAGFDFLSYGAVPTFRKLVTDGYSRNVRDEDIGKYGAHVSEPTSSCADLIAKGGPLQIANLVVNGDIPLAARDYIRNRFANGVVII